MSNQLASRPADRFQRAKEERWAGFQPASSTRLSREADHRIRLKTRQTEASQVLVRADGSEYLLLGKSPQEKRTSTPTCRRRADDMRSRYRSARFLRNLTARRGANGADVILRTSYPSLEINHYPDTTPSSRRPWAEACRPHHRNTRLPGGRVRVHVGYDDRER